MIHWFSQTRTVHKSVISQKRAVASAARTRKDLDQAEPGFSVILEFRPADITLAYQTAQAQGNSFVEGFVEGLKLIDDDIGAAGPENESEG